MVWGMALPEGFGEFWPDGDFEGWTDSLKSYFLEDMPADRQAPFGEGPRGALRYMGYVGQKFTGEPGSTPAPDRPPLSPIEPQEPPRQFDATRNYAELGSLIMLSNRIVAVDEALKDIIERLEPDVHQFYPFEMKMPKGRLFPKSYHIMVVGRYLSSFSAAESREGSWNEPRPGFYYHDTSKKGTSGLAFSRSKFGNAHFWRERGFREELTCLSDELKREVDAAGLRIPVHHQMLEV